MPDPLSGLSHRTTPGGAIPHEYNVSGAPGIKEGSGSSPCFKREVTRPGPGGEALLEKTTLSLEVRTGTYFMVPPLPQPPKGQGICREYSQVQVTQCGRMGTHVDRLAASFREERIII